METRKLPAVENRVETGPVQFGYDWPGIFIRGDNALAYAQSLHLAKEALDDACNDNTFLSNELDDLVTELRACDVRKG